MKQIYEMENSNTLPSAEQFELLLINLHACNEAKEWAKGKDFKTVWETCHRGDWLLWLFKQTNPNDLQLLTLAKGHCANTVRHLMKDERSIKVVDAAIAFGEGKISRDELIAAAYGYDIYAYDAAAANAAANAAADAAAYAYDAYDAAALIANQKQTADICRQYLPLNIWNL